MARPARLWQRKSDQWWYVTRGGKKLRLSKDRKEAEKAFHALLASDAEPEPSVRLRPTFRKVADAYLDHCREACTPETFAVRRQYLQSFCDHVKGRRVPDLRGEHVTACLKAKGWAKSTRALAVQIVKAAINHAVGQGTVAVSPLVKLKKGGYERRERILTPQERKQIRARIAGTPFADFVFALEQTGARPFSELATITADMVDWQAGSITLAEHKNVGEGKRRVIYCTPALIKVFRRLADLHPSGPLFRTVKGEPWTRQAAGKWMRKFTRELGIKGVTTYSFRTSYITDCLAKGIGVEIVAELCGTSPRMIWSHYNSIHLRPDALAAAARAAAT
jgi:integrase